MLSSYIYTCYIYINTTNVFHFFQQQCEDNNTGIQTQLDAVKGEYKIILDDCYDGGRPTLMDFKIEKGTTLNLDTQNKEIPRSKFRKG